MRRRTDPHADQPGSGERTPLPPAPLLLAASLLWACAPLGCTPSDAASVLSEEWHRLLLNGQPAGFNREIQEAKPSGNLATKSLHRLVVRRAEEPVAMEVSQEVEETPGGEIVRFRMIQRMAQNDVVVEGVVRGERMVVTSTGPGERRTFEVAYNPLAAGPRKVERLLLAKLRRSGDTASAVTFFPEKNVCGTLTATLGSEEVVRFPGGARRLTRRTSRMDILPGVDLHEWIDGEGQVWKTATQLLGMSMETFRSSSEEILREKYASLPEVFYSSSVRPDRPLRNPGGAREVLYRFTLKQGDFASRKIEGMFRGTGQTVVREESPRARVVRVARVRPEKKVKRPVRAPEGMEICLAPSAFIQSDDPQVAKLAKEAAGAETDAHEVAQRLELWVRRHVQFKDLKTPFASAKEVAQRLEGDCTEHGVLLAALARASGIPARVVSGLVYHEGAFVGHLWTEVYIDRWIPLDGTRGHGEVGPDHIALTFSPLSSSSAADLFFDLAQVIGNLQIDILEEN